MILLLVMVTSGLSAGKDVKKLLLKRSILVNAQLSERVHSRKRVSASVTAASARGLMQDSTSRIRVVNDEHIYSDVRRMAETFVSDSDLEAFIANIK